MYQEEVFFYRHLSWLSYLLFEPPLQALFAWQHSFSLIDTLLAYWPYCFSGSKSCLELVCLWMGDYCDNLPVFVEPLFWCICFVIFFFSSIKRPCLCHVMSCHATVMSCQFQCQCRCHVMCFSCFISLSQFIARDLVLVYLISSNLVTSHLWNVFFFRNPLFYLLFSHSSP